MVEDEKNHWISELFPVKYSTSDFLFEKKNNDVMKDNYKRSVGISKDLTLMNKSSLNKIGVGNRTKQRENEFVMANDFYSKIYSKVIEAETEVEERELMVMKNFEQYTSGECETVNQTQTTNRTTDYDSFVKGNEVKNGKADFWKNDDIHLLKDTYKKLREKSLWLLCILESRNIKIDELKLTNKELLKENNSLENEKMELKRQILKLESQSNVYVKNNKELESKLSFYEDCNNILSESLQKLKKELNMVTKNFHKSLKELNQTKMEYESTFSECKKQNNEHILKLSKDYELRIDKLKKHVTELETGLFSKNAECKKLVESLKYLDKHFLRNVEENSRNNEHNTIENYASNCNFLNVADI